MNRIKPISIEFKDSTPYSPLFQDVYYSTGTGIDESIHVYLEGSGFTETLTQNKDQKQFNVGEIGFGVGLNFLLTLRHFLKNSNPDQKLTYLSAEKYPIRIASLTKLYSSLPELSSVSHELLAQYPVLVPGIHSLSFAQGRVKLILMLGDAEAMFSNFHLNDEQKIEFWYWDGFAPNKNPDAFQDSLFKILLPLSALNAKAASFTSAGWVRRGLEALGCKVEKRTGYGNKRECIRAYLPPPHENKKIKKPWFSAKNLKTLKPGETIAVIGAGLSGTAIARALAERGFTVILLDQESIAAHASGNKAGLYNTQLSRVPNPISRFSQLSLTHFLRELPHYSIPTQKGILRTDDADFSHSEYPEDFYQNRKDGIFFPECGILNPKTLCEKRAGHPLIQVLKRKVSIVKKMGMGFILQDSAGDLIAQCDHVVYASGASQILDQYLSHSGLTDLPLKAIRGQVIYATPTTESKKITHTLLKDGYSTPIVPEITGTPIHCIGASFHAKKTPEDQEARDSEILLQQARDRHQSFASFTQKQVVSARIAYRLSTPDKLPLIGPLCDSRKLMQEYSKILHDGRKEGLVPLPAEEGEWLFLGMSSRGIIYSSYGAEILASLMCGEVLPIEADLWEHLHPARFIVRSLKKS